MPPYFYILALLTYLPISDLFAIKMVSSAVDIVLAISRQIWQRTGERASRRWLAAYCIVLFLPSVFLNSAVWGQCDAIYVSALLAFLYFVRRGRSNAAVLAFSISFVFKLQAVFFRSAAAVVSAQTVGAVEKTVDSSGGLSRGLPACRCDGAQPVGSADSLFFAGRAVQSSCHVPANLYTWLGDSTAAEISRAGVLLAGGVVLCAVFFLYRQPFEKSMENLVSVGLFFALLTPFLLPHIHERYYFLADLTSVVFAFWFPKKWGVAFTVCIASAYAVCHNLFGTDFFPVELLGVVLLFIICVMARHLTELLRGRRRPEMEIVPMQACHVDDLAEIERLCFAHPWTREGLAAELESPTAPLSRC